MELITLEEAPHLANEAFQLVESSFQYPQGHYFEIDFYPLTNSRNWHHCFIATENNLVIAHLGIKLRSIHHTPCAFLGGIAVKENFRGQNIFAQLYDFALDKLQLQNTPQLLWSHLHHYFKKFGFNSFGVHLSNRTTSAVKLGDVIPISQTNNHQRKLIKESFAFLANLGIITPRRDDKEWDEIFKTNSIKVLLPEAFPTTYAFIGKGADLSGIIHECSSQNESEIFNFVQHYKQYLMWLPGKFKNKLPDFDLSILALAKNTAHLEPIINELWIPGADSI